MYCPISGKWFDGFDGDTSDNMTVCRSDCSQCLTYVNIEEEYLNHENY